MAYLSDFDPETFDPDTYFNSRMPGYASMSVSQRKAMRITMTRDDPLLFALVYFRKTLQAGGDGKITFADFHGDLCRIARYFRGELDPVNPLRFAFIAPRRAGKTSWLYKIISSWVACHQHRKFFYVVTGTGKQAQRWIVNFKRVVEQNRLIREDYPGLCEPLKRESTGRAFTDDANLYVAKSGFIIGAQGADGNSLGLNVDDERPDFILFDDIEPPGGDYSLLQMTQRLTNVIDGAIPMGQEGAIVIFVGTVLMPGSIMDQLRVYAVQPDPKSWISDLNIRVRHYMPFVDQITKEQTVKSTPNSRSFWPGRHKTAVLLRDQNTRYFATAYANEPLPEDGEYWKNDFIRGTIPADEPTVTFASLDPAVTTKRKSDFSALSVIRFAPRSGQFEVLYGRAFKLSPGAEMPQKVLQVIGYFPEIVGLVVEQNQGGDTWREHYGSIPGVTYIPVHQTSADGNKANRAAKVLRLYDTGKVYHSTEQGADTAQLESEMYSFPKGLHDDLVDSLTTGILTLQRHYGAGMVEDTESSYI